MDDSYEPQSIRQPAPGKRSGSETMPHGYNVLFEYSQDLRFKESPETFFEKLSKEEFKTIRKAFSNFKGTQELMLANQSFQKLGTGEWGNFPRLMSNFNSYHRVVDRIYAMQQYQDRNPRADFSTILGEIIPADKRKNFARAFLNAQDSYSYTRLKQTGPSNHHTDMENEHTKAYFDTIEKELAPEIEEIKRKTRPETPTFGAQEMATVNVDIPLTRSERNQPAEDAHPYVQIRAEASILRGFEDYEAKVNYLSSKYPTPQALQDFSLLFEYAYESIDEKFREKEFYNRDYALAFNRSENASTKAEFKTIARFLLEQVKARNLQLSAEALERLGASTTKLYEFNSENKTTRTTSRNQGNDPVFQLVLQLAPDELEFKAWEKLAGQNKPKSKH